MIIMKNQLLNLLFLVIHSLQKNINSFSNLENKIVGIDMELMAIAQICQKNKIDIFSLKFVSDFVLAYKQHSTYQTSLKELQKK